jgi:transposase
MSTITNRNGKRDRDSLVIAALARGASYADAARVAGVSKATVSRRMAEPTFRGRVAKEREETLERVRGTLVEGSLAAARTLVELGENTSILYTGWAHWNAEPNGTYVFRFTIHGTLNGIRSI